MKGRENYDNNVTYLLQAASLPAIPAGAFVYKRLTWF
jgi:hypothetical protein